MMLGSSMASMPGWWRWWRRGTRFTYLALASLFVSNPLLAEPLDDHPSWPQFRGEQASGISLEEGVPTKWSTTENVRWQISIPGRGWSSPIVWDDRVYVTAAVSQSDFKQPSPGIYGNDFAAELADQGLSDEEVLDRVVKRDIELAAEIGELRYMLFAFSVEDGRKLWELELHRGAPFGGRHRKNTYASETPLTDGEHVYAYFGNVGLFCVRATGELVWSKRWEPQSIYLDFGTASSPAMYGDQLFVLHDNQGESFITAVDRHTGRERWRRERDFTDAMIRSGWSTPFVWDHEDRTEVVAIGQGLAVSYGLDGEELWRMSGLSGQATPTPTVAGDALFLGTGSQGESNRPLFSVRPGARGDITLAEKETSNRFVAWMHPRASAYTSSPLVFDGRVYVVNDNGILSVFDADEGTRLYRARVGGGGHTFSSSPWAHGGLIFLLSEGGETFVVQPGEAYEELHANTLDELTLSTPAVAAKSVFIRTETKLYRIAER